MAATIEGLSKILMETYLPVVKEQLNNDTYGLVLHRYLTLGEAMQPDYVPTYGRLYNIPETRPNGYEGRSTVRAATRKEARREVKRLRKLARQIEKAIS